MLSATDPLPARPRRVLVAGASGSGKTTLAQAVAFALGVAHTEIDGLFHGPAWTKRPQFEAEVEAFTRGATWVTEWQYGEVRPLLLARADLMVWLDLPRHTVMRQVVRRTLRRRLRRLELWHGNVEPPLRTFFTDSEHIVRWAWATHSRVRDLVLEAHLETPGLPVVRLRSRAEVTRWLRGPLAVAARAG